MKGITREFSGARTPQQNGVTERKNRTLIEATRTMLADLLLPIPFWAEVVNTARYVQNRILMTKPHNKTPYELLLGRSPSIGFMRPFGCPITILNTQDPLEKFDGKADEGLLVGYSVNSKAFRGFNSRTRIVQETLHINFLEKKPNVAGIGPKWLFDIDTLTQSMNYQSVVAGNQPNDNAGIKENLNAGKVGKETVSGQQYVRLPLWSTGSQDPHNTDAAFDVKENEKAVYVSPSMTYDKVRSIFEREYKKVQTLFKPNKDVKEPNKKRVSKETLLQESFMKLKAVEVSGSESTQKTPTNDLKEVSKEDVQNMLEIVPVSKFKVEALQDKDLFKSKDAQVVSDLGFDNVYFVNELMFNLFSVSQRCDKKNSVLFTDTECVVLSSDYKLPDKKHVLLRVPRENNMYNVNLKNVVLSGDLTCLFAKATLDESNLWHKRHGHINFKTMNKLVKGNLVRGLPSKIFKIIILVLLVKRESNIKPLAARTRLADSLLPIPFWVEKPNVARIGPKWLFDIDTLTQSMNYQPVVIGNQPNDNVGIKENIDAENKKAVHVSLSGSDKPKKMIIYLKNMSGGMTYDKVRPIFEREHKKVQTLFKPDKDVEEPKKKRVAEETLLQEKGSRTYWKIIRVGGITEAYQSFEDMLKGFDKEDLVALWSLVKEKFSTAVPSVDKEKALWVDLKRLFEPEMHMMYYGSFKVYALSNNMEGKDDIAAEVMKKLL
nr:retrovirus-related Pol polyprotein from transposon TNT 1-94 [Tanacetum cinerariifolium]